MEESVETEENFFTSKLLIGRLPLGSGGSPPELVRVIVVKIKGI